MEIAQRALALVGLHLDAMNSGASLSVHELAAVLGDDNGDLIDIPEMIIALSGITISLLNVVNPSDPWAVLRAIGTVLANEDQ